MLSVQQNGSVNKQKFRKCFIPGCESTSVDSSKIFVGVPINRSIRKLWWDRAKLSCPLKSSHLIFCCIDHFDIPDDFENWFYFCTFGKRLVVKVGVLPHKYLDGTSKSKEDDKLDVARRKEIIDNLLAGSKNVCSFPKETNDLSLSNHNNLTSCNNSPAPLDEQHNLQQKTETKFGVLTKPTCICLCGDSSINNISYHVDQQIINTQLNNSARIKRRKNCNFSHIPEDFLPTKRKQPNILTRPTNKSKADTHNEKEKQVTNNNSPSCVKRNGIVETTRLHTLSSSISIGNVQSLVIPEIHKELGIGRETGSKKKREDHHIPSLDGDLMNVKGVEKAKGKETVELTNSLMICEETGLFKNLNNEYFNGKGELINQHEVETEKRSATIRGHHLFRIDEIFSVSDEKEQSAQKTVGEMKKSKNETMLTNHGPEITKTETNLKGKNLLRIRDISSMTNQFIYSNKGDLETDKGNIKRKGENQLRIRKMYTIKSNCNSKEEIHENKEENVCNPITKKIVQPMPFTVMANEKDQQPNKVSQQPVRPQIKIRHISSKFPSTVKNTIQAILEPPLEKSPLLSETPSKVAFAQLAQNPSDKVINIMNTKVDGPDPCETNIQVKEELPDVDNGRQQLKDLSIDDEETSSAPETMCHENLQGLMDSLDAADNYVDVPEFVHINNFTFQDLELLREQGLTSSQDKSRVTSFLHAIPTAQDPLSKFNSDLTLNDLLKTRPENAKSTGEEMLERLIVNEIEKARPDEMNQSSNNSLEQKTGLESRQLPKKILFGGRTLVKCGDSYRDIEKMPPSKRQRKRKLKIVPVVEKPVVAPKSDCNERLICHLKTSKKETETKYPDREVCVLFTNYSDDGLYINDHDYLVTPYKRNRILLKENGENFCICYICGSKHNIAEHVCHMNSHNPKCPLCNINLGTGYMLNLHMKAHAITCNYCLELVAYSKVSEHEKNHSAADIKITTLRFDGSKTNLNSGTKSPNKKKTSKKKSPLAQESLQNEKSPGKKLSSSQKPLLGNDLLSDEGVQMGSEPKVEQGIKAELDNSDIFATRSIMKRKNTDELVHDEVVAKRVLRSASKKTESRELPCT